MMDLLESLINALRDELQQYGEMLALLDQQQESVMSRAADQVLEGSAAVQAQSRIIQLARDRRESFRRQLAQAVNQPAAASFAELLPELPAHYRPLLSALVQENNELLVRVQQRARQNHLLLSRSLDLMQRFLGSLLPALRPSVYTGAGHVLAPQMSLRPLYDAVG
jgi:flagellar biosynthesis/type III secretory pathway chaperone